jgi:hypothetical protein
MGNPEIGSPACQRPPVKGGRCQDCQDVWNLWRRERNAARRAAGLCVYCGSQAHEGASRCDECQDEFDRIQARLGNRRAKERRQDRIFALLGRLRGRRQEWAFWVLRQLGYELDERHYLVARPAACPGVDLVQVDYTEMEERVRTYGAEHPLAQVYPSATTTRGHW